jgi:Putative MetA-pathway of phenol degradation
MYRKLLIKKIAFFCLLLGSLTASAQTPTDGLMMKKGENCSVLAYSNSTWENYWEGEKKRSNTNLGKFTAENVMFMSALGITDKLNVIIGLPYVRTSASVSYLAGQQGVQDFSLWLKYQLWKKESNTGTLRLFATGGASMPTNNYVADFLPFSIGMQSKTASGRLILNYNKSGFYINTQFGATLRSKTTVDRNSFIFANKLYQSDVMPVPNVVDGSLTFGFVNTRFQTFISVDKSDCLSGDDIRYNDAPILTNKMASTSVNWFGKVNIRKLSIIASAGRVLNGRNVGEATSFGAGVAYFFQVFNKETMPKQ